jgi:hypothetical protein
VVIEGFYSDPMAVRNYALRQWYYIPYEDPHQVSAGKQHASWWASRFKKIDDCPFKSSAKLIETLEWGVGEAIDMEHWSAPYPVDEDSKPFPGALEKGYSCLWNCCFHVKPDNQQRLGDGVHNHVTDNWNSVGTDGWAGIIYLNPNSPIDGGLHLWCNIRRAHQFDWMTPAKNWQLIDSFGNLFNRLVLVRGNIPHSGAAGWGSTIEDGRMFQTFFFKTISQKTVGSVSMAEIG